jgi:hypothetical protein
MRYFSCLRESYFTYLSKEMHETIVIFLAGQHSVFAEISGQRLQ